MEEDLHLLKFVSTVSMVSAASEFLEYFIVSYSHTRDSGFWGAFECFFTVLLCLGSQYYINRNLTAFYFVCC